MKNLLVVTVMVATLLPTVLADPPTAKVSQVPPTRLTPLMRMKLDKSKEILEGLALDDFEKIAANAKWLRLLSTESGWNVVQTDEYASQSRDFQRAADLIAQAAKDKDIHRATMGYVALTVRCVECHSYMREHRVELTRVPVE